MDVTFFYKKGKFGVRSIIVKPDLFRAHRIAQWIQERVTRLDDALTSSPGAHRVGRTDLHSCLTP